MLTRLAFKNVLLFALIVLAVANASATHPQLLMDAKEMAFIRAKVAANTADWQAVKATCDALAQDSVLWPQAISGGNSPLRGYVVHSGYHGISSGYYGSGFYGAIAPLGACYQALKPTNPAAAGVYLAQAHNIITAIAQPPLVLTRQSDGSVRYGHSLDGAGNDLRAGAPLSVYLTPNNAVAVGDIWTISGARGCTSMNGKWKVSATNGNLLFFTKPDGTPAPVLNADCTLYSVVPTASSGYGMRFWVPALAVAYDWFYSGLSASEKSEILATINAWTKEVTQAGHGLAHPESNFFAGYFWGMVAGYVGTYGDDPAMTSWLKNAVAAVFTAPHMLRDYRNLWFAGGGAGEGWQAYGYLATRNVMNAVLAMKMLGVDWTQPPYNFTFVDDTLRYWMQFTSPPKLALDDNEYVYPIGATDPGVTEPLWIPLGHAAMFSAAARRFGSPYAAKFQSWWGTVFAKEQAAAGKNIPAWSSGPYTSQPDSLSLFLYYDPNAPSSDWTTLPLMYRGWGGDYGVTRTDWSDTAVEVTLLGGPTLGNAGNGKTQFNSGAITVRRGNNQLVVYGLAEASRAYDIISHAQQNALHNERLTYGNRKNSIFWAGAGPEELHNQGLGSRTPPPGQLNAAVAWKSSLDRSVDTTDYTYWRASGLEANSRTSSIDGKFHQSEWTREVFFLRPKLVVVHDRTVVLNNGDDRAMFWTFGRNITQVAVPGNLTRYDASYQGTYRGTFWSVLPASPSTVSVVDHDDLHFLYRVEVRPAVNDHLNDNWLAVLDAADGPQNVNHVTSLTAANADAVQFDDANHTVVAFSQSTLPTLPMTITVSGAARVYVTGLNANTNYKVTTSSTGVTIAANEGASWLKSSTAGVLTIQK